MDSPSIERNFETDFSIDLPETAARRPNVGTKFTSPMEMVKKNLYGIVLNANSLFRLGIMGSLLNGTMNEEFSTTDMANVIGFDLNPYAEPVTADRLRETAMVKPGNGKTKPIAIEFTESLFNIGGEIVERIVKLFPKDIDKGITFSAFYQHIYNMGISPTVMTALTPALETFKEKYLEPLNDFVEFKISINTPEYNSDTHTANLDFTISIELEPDVYKEVIDSDEFSAYLVYLWVYNSLRLTKNRLNAIVDPRKVSAHKNAMLKLGPIKPKVNKAGFAIHGSGNPIFIPPNRDTVDQFIKTANACIDENGVFRRDFLVDEHGLGDAIIYVDWVNDILAYTTSTGILSTFDLGNVTPFDPVTEYNYLSTPLKSQVLVPITSILTESFKDMEGSDAEKYTNDEEAKRILRELPPIRIYTNIINATNAANVDDVTLYHVCGGYLEELEDVNGLIPLVKALKALIKHLNAIRKSDKEALKLPARMKSQGIIHRLIGVEYVLQAIDKYDEKTIDSYRQAWRTERAKFVADSSVKFDIPNIKVGKGGLTGLLPHQGRILSSAIKSPHQSIKSVSTGGGKTIISIVQSIFGIVNTKTIPMILTKANLIRGTITEINQICKGEINAIPFTPITLRRMSRISGIDTFAKLLKWYQKLPKNTILVGSYSSLASRRKLYPDLDIVDGFCEFSIPTTQFMLIIKLLGIRFISGDESHMIKNPESARSRNSYAIFSHADYRDVMSGTIVSNTVPDLVGQARAISPFIFGDDPVEFADRYGLSQGLIKSDDDAKKIKNRLKSTTAYHEANEEDWAYMLPAMDDEVLFANMTPLQHEFYNLLMQEAELILLELEKSKKKIKSEDDDDEDDEEEDDDEGEDGDDAEEARIVAAAKVHLQKVEMFLVAPDSNEQYTSWERKPAGEDLISPKVRLADKLIEEHVIKHKDDLPNNKIIVFGWNIVSAEHFMRHSKFASKSLHYTAGNEEIVRQFETNPTNIILCATEGSMREGFNLQMTSLICRMQSVWAPGEHKQARARMFRPDPRGKYNREKVRHVWIMTRLPNNQPTLDGVKIARLISKYISNARLTYEGRMAWRQVSGEFDELKMLKMNLDLIFNSRDYDLEPYFQAWKTYVNWENNLNKQAKRRMAERLEQENDVDLLDDKGNIIDINKFIQLAMYEVESTYKIPGSKRVYVPFIRNALPADPNNYGFSVLGNNDVPVGTVIYTEFGPAIVKASMKKAVKVQLYNGRTVSLKKGTVHVAAPSKYKEFAKTVKDPIKWRNESFDPLGVTGTAKVDKTKLKDEEEVIETLEDNLDNEEEDKDEVEIYAGILNSWPALIVDEDIKELKNLDGWNRIDPFTSVSFRSWAAAEKLLDIIDSKMHIPDKTYEALKEEMEEIRDGKAMQLTKQINLQKFRNFFLDQRKKLGTAKNGKVIVNPYWIVNETDVLLAFDTNSHDPRFIAWLGRNRAKFPGVINIRKNEAMWINIFKSVREAMEDLRNLSTIRSIDIEQIKRDLVDVKDEILKLKRPRSRPKM